MWRPEIGFRTIAALHYTGMKKNMVVLLEGVSLLTFQHTGEALSALELLHPYFCLPQFFEAPQVQQPTYSITLLHLLFLVQQDQQELSFSHCSVLLMLA
jgi:hypothetical protein